MKCPACLTLMSNRDEVHKIASNINRMNLHCQNQDCPSRKMGVTYSPHMQVITNDPNPWECVRYGLIFFREEKPILLEGEFGYNYTAARILGKGEHSIYSPLYYVGSSNNIFIAQTPPRSIMVWKDIKRIPFVRLDTGDDMHMHAHETMEKLTKLIAFM